MDDLLNFDISTTPGEVAYQVSSEEMAVLFILSVISEGYKEEPKYLSYIQMVCKNNDAAQVVIHVVNRHYKRQESSAGRNHPMNRLQDLIDWKNNHKPIEGCVNNDEYWLICDRDTETFTTQQYDTVLDICKSEKINFIISNPAFQIWLLLHFTGNLSSYELDCYEKSSDILKKVIEPAIKSFDSRYKHGKINMATFGPRIKNAIINSEPYAFDTERLKNEIGTNFRMLLLRIEQISGKPIFQME